MDEKEWKKDEKGVERIDKRCRRKGEMDRCIRYGRFGGDERRK